jgi:hypothetical protein
MDACSDETAVYHAEGYGALAVGDALADYERLRSWSRGRSGASG